MESVGHVIEKQKYISCIFFFAQIFTSLTPTLTNPLRQPKKKANKLSQSVAKKNCIAEKKIVFQKITLRK